MIAGPSEILVFADKKTSKTHCCRPSFTGRTRRAAQSILITDSNIFAKNVISEIDILLKQLKRRHIAKKLEKIWCCNTVEKLMMESN